MSTHPKSTLVGHLRVRARRILRGVITFAIGLTLCFGLPGNTGIWSVFTSTLHGLFVAALFLPVYAVPSGLIGMLMPRLARLRPVFLAVTLAAALGGASGLAMEWSMPPNRNPLVKLTAPPPLAPAKDGHPHGPVRTARHWVSVNWSACFFASWFAGWALLERRRPEVPLPKPPTA
jgi:hypothetical protein